MEEYPSNINVQFSDFSLKIKEKIKSSRLIAAFFVPKNLISYRYDLFK